MLSPEDNEILTRVAADRPMGQLLRRFWMPALLSDEVQDPDGAPVRVELLGEHLVAFRDSEGRVGLLDAYCAHRRADLFWGRNEECGLRCVYHGWKYDVNGNCVDLPNVDRGDGIKRHVKVKAYPTIECGGFIWTYLGPPELKPAFPEAEVYNLPPDQRHICKVELEGNWFQFLEGDIDASHVTFLHKSLDGSRPTSASYTHGFQFVDPKPVYSITPTAYGLMLAARRQVDDENYSWRATQWLMPFTAMIAARADAAFMTNIRVPVNDHKSIHYRIMGRCNGPLTAEDRKIIENGVMFPELIPGTFQTAANRSNNYKIDRELQKTKSYTGIRSVPVQDYAVTQSQGPGPIADRSLEFLTNSDAAIVAVRNRMLRAAKALSGGIEPSEPGNAIAYRIRSVDTVAPKDVDMLTAIADALPSYTLSALRDR